MASPSEEQKNREETPTVKEMMHKMKIIQFLGRTTPIILQNDNGPCPLLAICNILLLRNNLSLSSDVAEVSQEKLLSLVAERLIDSNSNVDVIALPIFVHLINDFEFTRECAIFDLLDIPLYHGWIVDAQKNPEEGCVAFVASTTASLEVLSPSLSRGSPHPISDEQIERERDLEEEGELLRALKLSETVGPTSASDVNVTGTAEETLSENLKGEYLKHEPALLGDALQVHTNAKVHEPSTAESSNLVNNYNDDLITFETIPGQEVCSSLEADKESHNRQMNTNVSERHESNDGIEKTVIEVSAKKENVSLGFSESDPSPPVDIPKDNSGGNEKTLDQSTMNADANEVEKVNIDEKTSNELYSAVPDAVLESSKGMTQTINESNSVTSTADGNEPIYREECILETSTKTNEGREPIYVGEVVMSEQVDKDDTSADDTRPKDGTTARQGELITNFLKNSASQLTIHGLFSLQDGLRERELCVFFRNNHFNTMFKFEGELYILATDQGYINQPDLVWEKLNEVNGDSVFMTNNFKKFTVENHDTRSWNEQNVMANTVDYLARIDNTAQGDTSFNSDLQLAIALQQQEFEQQQQQPQRVLPQSPTTAPSGLVVGPQHVRPARPRNATSSIRQEPKPTKEKCIVM
ncbi:Protein of unknown function DUF544 [Cynara cardunculus var. scolymus]|uniref:MINDY deubiquitinase domain-containing protein n=1 Tax=Cynara cardunculus var. scolymus TaxID=59895 RepID=A0A118JUL0_CYNCS|nr:Protein of unknown function DUF544 [Cynara cardunculus var. scolymus]